MGWTHKSWHSASPSFLSFTLVFQGYKCICPIEFAGDYCERRSAHCKEEDCNSGICEEVGDTWHCVCPLNATGLRCEIPVEQPSISSIGFKSNTSFMTMPSPKSLDHFQISMNLKPEDVERNRMLLYVASDYDPESKKHMSVSVMDGSIVYSYSDGEDFVPTFFGQETLILPSMTDEQLTNLDVTLSFNPDGNDGVIFETARRPSLPGEDPALISRPPNIEHRARIDHGAVVYEYDIGYGKESIVSPNNVTPHEWNTVRLINNDTKAVLQLNSGPATEKSHPPIRFEQGSNGPVFLGGLRDPTDPDRTHQGYRGVISSMTVSGKPVDLGSVERQPDMISHDSCKHSLCLHSSRCRNANTPKGYMCICLIEFAGEYCERRSAHCKEEDCNSGICEEVGDTWHCVCPLNATGLRCEIPVEQPSISSIGFKSDTSFMTMPSPKSLDHFQISMNLKPEDVERNRMLLYVASDYDPESKKHMSVSVMDGSIVYSYSDGEDREEIRSAPVEPGVVYTVVLSRNDSTTSLFINDQMFEKKNELKTFEPGTELFVGGLPPGIDVPEDVPATSFFGCINEISVDGTELDFNDQSTFNSGDVSQCVMVEEVFPTKVFTPELPPTTEVTTTKFTTTEVTTTEVTTTEVTTTEEVIHVYNTVKDVDAPEPILQKVDESEEEEHEVQEPTPTPASEEESPIEEISSDQMPTVELSTDDPCATEGLGEACLDKACLDNECGPNGECVPVNQTYYRCQCNLYYDGPRCDLFKPIERAAKFDGDAFLEISADEFPHLTSEKKEVVEFKFKTSEPDGVIFWQGQQPGASVVGEDYFSVGLSEGRLHFSYELGGGAAHMVSQTRVDDDKEHYVRIERQGRRGILKVDNELEQSGLSSGILAMLNADGNIFIGGVPDVYRDTGGLHSKNFIGCVADVALNGEILDLMGTAIDGKNARPCDEWISPRRRRLKHRRRHRDWILL
ncbi:hypothetical protein GCK32_004642 [Trichostrongylus colubriformis]|uniref:Basement membrane-specific heparan sulfate proteoglycan core protein n=1 Tax=Trichostrongylus colubriformis TaxID=6319 RepID=A0AAN8FUD6_TRICO